MNDFKYDAVAISNLESFVSYLKDNDVKVTLVLSPYHPQLYQLMESRKPIFLELERWYRDFADENEIQIIGSYDGRKFGCSGEEFFDGMHPKSSCLNKLFINNHEEMVRQSE